MCEFFSRLFFGKKKAPKQAPQRQGAIKRKKVTGQTRSKPMQDTRPTFR